MNWSEQLTSRPRHLLPPALLRMRFLKPRTQNRSPPLPQPGRSPTRFLVLKRPDVRAYSNVPLDGPITLAISSS